MSACSLCGTTQEAGLRWQEQERKYEERRAAAFTDARDDGSDTLWQDPEQQLTLR